MSADSSPASASIQILRLPQVCGLTGLGKSTIYRLELADHFPRRIKIGIRAIGWLETDVRAWLLKRTNGGWPLPTASS
jgi:prophage regulatory protein